MPLCSNVIRELPVTDDCVWRDSPIDGLLNITRGEKVVLIRVVVLRDYRSLSEYAAGLVGQRIRRKPAAVLGLASGSTPLGLYRELIRMVREKRIDLGRVVTFNLDEYYPIDRENSQSYHYFMRYNFWEPAGIPPDRAYIPAGKVDDIAAFCLDYERQIRRAGGIDLQILGIGVNGHIGFNEPGDELIRETHLAALSPETIESNSRFFETAADVPRMAISMGMGTIMKAREILLLASGSSKAAAIKKAIKGELSTMVPASLLQLHPRVTVLLDRKAARGLG